MCLAIPGGLETFELWLLHFLVGSMILLYRVRVGLRGAFVPAGCLAGVPGCSVALCGLLGWLAACCLVARGGCWVRCGLGGSAGRLCLGGARAGAPRPGSSWLP